VCHQLTISLRETINLSTESRIGIQSIKEILCCIEQIDLVRGNQSTQLERIVFDVRYSFSILLHWSLQREIDSYESGIFKAQNHGPAWKEARDR
jgi:hypothetical protein